MKGEVKHQLDDLTQMGAIEPSNSPWSSPIHMVQKKSGSWRLVVDFRLVNKRVIKDAYPLPLINDILNTVTGQKYYTVIDLRWGFYNIPLSEPSKSYTAFATHLGLFQFKVLPFGFCNSPAIFQREMDRVLGDTYGRNVN